MKKIYFFSHVRHRCIDGSTTNVAGFFLRKSRIVLNGCTD